MTTSTGGVALPSEPMVLRADDEIAELQQRRTTTLEMTVEVQSELTDLSAPLPRLLQLYLAEHL